MSAKKLIGEGDPMPSFELAIASGGTVTLNEFTGRPAVLFFYPKDDTPGCTSEAKDFSALKPQFDEAGIALLGISKDGPDRHRKFVAKHALTVPLATDAAKSGLSDALGIWVQKLMYGKEYMGMVRTTYLVDKKGYIVRIWRKVKVVGHAAEVLHIARGSIA